MAADAPSDRLEAAKAQMELARVRRSTGIQSHQNHPKELEARLAALPKATSLRAAEERAELENSVLGRVSRFARRRTSTYTGKKASTPSRSGGSRAMGKPSSRGVARLEQATAATVQNDREWSEPSRAIDRALLVFVPDAAVRAERTTSLDASLASARLEPRASELSQRLADHERRVQAAWMAGDLVALQQALGAMRTILDTARSENLRVNTGDWTRGGVTRRLADATVQFAANPAGGRQLYLEAQKLYLEDASPNRRASLEESLRTAPKPDGWLGD